MGTMTKDELTAHIKECVLPLIKDTIGTQVAELIRETNEKAGPPKWAEMMFMDRKEESRLFQEKKPVREKGIAVGAIVRATAAAKLAGAGVEYSLDILKSWGYDDLADDIKVIREKALSAGDATAGGFIVPTQFSQELIEVLRATAVVRGMNPVTMSMPSGTVRIPKITAGSAASYIGENTNITKTQPAFGQITLSFKKLAALVPVSNDLIRYSSPGADAIVRNDVVNALREREDKAFIRDDGTGGTPKGLRHWALPANVIAANGTVNLANVTVDLGTLIERLMANNVPMISPAWLMSPRSWRYLTTVRDGNGNFAFRTEMMNKTLWGWPFGVTTAIPENLTDGGGTDESEVYLFDAADAIIGEAQRIIIDASGDAAYHDGSNVVAAYSLDQTVVRAIAEHDFAVRRDASVAVLNEVTMGT